jgi:hypothetical protein
MSAAGVRARSFQLEGVMFAAIQDAADFHLR